jgi:hypothetical protein
MLVRRRGLAAATLCVAFATRAQAKDYPTHPVRIVSDSATTRRACDRSVGSDVAVTSRKSNRPRPAVVMDAKWRHHLAARYA